MQAASPSPAPAGSGGPSAQMSPAVQQSQIPDLLNIGAIPTDQTMDVETSVLEPVVHSDSFCRFVLQNKGILHSHSKIVFALNMVGAQATLPLSTGIYGLIQNATLKIGGKTITEIDDFGDYMSYKSLFTNNEAMKEREQYTTGRQMSYGVNYKNREKNDGANYQYGFSGVDANVLGEGLTIENNYDQCVSTDMDNSNTTGPNKVDPFQPTPFYLQLSKESTDDLPTWQMSLADLFPFLRTNQLPLYMMKEEVSLELTFSQAGTASAVSKTTSSHRVIANTTNGLPATILTAETRMIADYIYYPQEMMEQYAAANQSLQFTFPEYRLSKFSITGANMATQQIRNIGGAGRVVSKVFFGFQSQDRNQTSLLNKYGAEAPGRDYKTGTTTDTGRKNFEATINVKYNDNFVYPIDVSNSARHFHNISQAEAIVPFVSREVYGREGESVSGNKYGVNVEDGVGGGTPLGFPMSGKNQATALAQDLTANSNLPGQMMWFASRLNKGERVNSRGIELYFKFGAMPLKSTGPDTYADYVQRCWLEQIKVAELSNGVMTSYFA